MRLRAQFRLAQQHKEDGKLLVLSCKMKPASVGETGTLRRPYTIALGVQVVTMECVIIIISAPYIPSLMWVGTCRFRTIIATLLTCGLSFPGQSGVAGFFITRCSFR